MKFVTAVVLALFLTAVGCFQSEEEELEMKRRQALENEGAFEGDIILDDDQDRSAAIKFDTRLWPDAKIYYDIEPALEFLRDTINEAMWHIQNHTCLRFVEDKTATARVHMVRKPGCQSKLGMTGSVQDLHLGQYCEPFGTVVHELLHAAGLLHEHTRSDRDRWVLIVDRNIQAGKEHNFNTRPEGDKLLSPFDYNSIMIYGENAFSVSPYQRTIIPLIRGVKLTNPYAKSSMTASDISGVRRLYSCP